MNLMNWRVIASAAAMLAACLVAACGGGDSTDSELSTENAAAQGAAGAEERRTVQAQPPWWCRLYGCPIRLKIAGDQVLNPYGKPIRLRGVNLDGLTSEEAQTIAGQFNMNLVRMRISFTPANREDTESGFKQTYLDEIDAWVNAAKAQKLWIVLEMRVSDDMAKDPAFYDTSKTADCVPARPTTCPNFGNYLKAWRYLAGRYKSVDYIAGYGLLAEPSAEKAGYADPVAQMVSFQRRLMDEITALGDKRTPFFIGPIYNYDTMEYRLDDYFIAEYAGRLVYEVNFLSPKEWIKNGSWTLPCPPPKQPEDCKPTYPFPNPVDGYESLLDNPKDGEPMEWTFNNQRILPGNYEKTLSPGFIEWYLQWPLEFRKKHPVPLYVDQFGASSFAKGQLAYEQDLIDYFEANGLHWTRWSYNAGGDSDEGRSRTLLEPNYAAIDFYTKLAPRWGR